MKNKKGFTLVELLIVIAVLGVIAAIAVPRYSGVMASVRTNAELRTADLFAKEIEVEFVMEQWPVAAGSTLTVAPVAADAAANARYNGTIPNSNAGTPMTAVIARTGDVYTLLITNGATTPVTIGAAARPLSSGL